MGNMHVSPINTGPLLMPPNTHRKIKHFKLRREKCILPDEKGFLGSISHKKSS